MKLAWAFFKRDAAIALSYRAAFFAQFVSQALLLSMMYFLGKTVGPQALPALARYGGNFLAFLLIGISLTDCVSMSLVSFATQVREAQTTGTLEATLLSPVRLSVILIYSSLWNYFMCAVRFLLYLVVGGAVYGLDFSHARLLSAALLFLLTVFCFMGVGVLWAGIVLIVKRGEGVITAGSILTLMLSGVVFPVSALPAWVQKFSPLIPLTVALDGMRLALLKGFGLRELSGTIATLMVFAVVLLTVGILGFNLAVQIGRRTGSLTQY